MPQFLKKTAAGYGLSAFLLAVIFSPLGCFAQSPNETFSKLSVEHGLSSVTVTAITRDSKGYLWAGTEDGLNRYNGYNFKIYRNDPSDTASLFRNRILSVFASSEHLLWVSFGGGGVQFYNRETDGFVRVRQFDTLIIKKISEDRSKRMWFVGSAVKSLDMQSGEWRDYSHLFPAKELILSINQIAENEYWVTSEQGLYRWNRQSGTVQPYRHDPADPNSLSCNSIYASLMDDKGNLWVATRGGGLDKFDAEAQKLVHFRQAAAEEDGPLVNTIRSLCLDGDYLWLGTENGGLSKLDTRTYKFVHYTSDKNFPRGLNDNSIWSMYKDPAGSLWIGTFSFGLCVIDPYQDKFSSLKVPLKNTIVNSIFKDSKKRLWIGTEGGVTMVDKGKVSYFLDGPNLKSKNGVPVLTIYEDRQGNIWIGTWSDGVFLFDEQSGRLNHFAREGPGPQDLSNNHIYAILQDSQTQSLLIGSFLGLNVLEPERKHIFRVIDSTQTVIAPHNNLKALLEDRNSNLWIGTCNGLKLYDRNNHRLTTLFKDPERPGQYLSAIVFCLYEDRSGNIWAGTETGLYHIQSPSEFVRYTVEDGLSNHSIMGILEDKKGNLWLSTSNGLMVFNPKTRYCRNYDASDGLFVNGFKANACFSDAEGMYYFGGSDGVVVFDPEKIIDNPNVPQIVFEDFRIFNESVKVYDKDSILDKHISETRELVLDYDADIISIEYAALNFSASSKNKYAYRLTGFDKNWNYVGSSRVATYTNLDPGQYVFEVIAANNDGLWASEPAQLAIKIMPPWWESPFAYVLYVLGILGLFYVFRKVILIKEKYVNDIKLERIKTENMERLNQAKLEFFTNISHELRTPLTLIVGPVQHLIDSRQIDESIKTKMQAIKLNANRLHRLVNQLLDFRKAESGNMKIVAMEGDLVAFLGEIKQSFDHLAEELKINFEFHHSSATLMAWFDHDQLEKVIFNLLSNAFKNTKAGASVSIHLREEGEGILIEVEDTGRGIKTEHLKNIFQAFFSAETGKHGGGTGIGLALSKSLVELHHGTIDVESREGQFTRFTVKLQKGYAHFKPTEIAPNFFDEESTGLKEVLPYHQLSPPAEETIRPEAAEKRTILVVDDNREVANFLVSILQPEYNVKTASNGSEGLELAAVAMPDLILCDVMMPAMDGISLCRQLKDNIKTCHIPLIFLTARTSNIYKLEGLEHGAFDYITKPFDSRVLLLKIRNLLQTRDQLSSAFSQKQFLQIEPKEVTLNSKDELFIEAALNSVEENIENTEYGVNDLCKAVGMSKATLFRKLKALTNQSANEFIRTIRLKRAAQLLNQNGYSVSEVAYKVGFNDPKYFRICFKKLFGVCPSEYSLHEKQELKE